MNVQKSLRISNLALLVILAYTTMRAILVPGDISSELGPPTASGGAGQGGEIDQRQPVEIAQAREFDFANIADRDDLFACGSSVGDAAGLAAESLDSPDDLKLIGTIASNSTFARAIITDLSAKTTSHCRVGDVIAGARIKEISRNSVLIIRNGRRLTLQLSVGFGGESVNRAGAVASGQDDQGQPERPMVVENIDIQAGIEGLQAVVASPNMTIKTHEGLAVGVIAAEVSQADWAKRLGIKDGDIIKSINGQKLTSKKKAFQVLQKARTQPTLDVEVVRGGQVIVFSLIRE